MILDSLFRRQPRRSHGGRLQKVSIATLACLLVATLLGTWVVHRVVHEQERRLLGERGREVQLVLSDSISPVVSSLTSLGEALRAAGTSTGSFRRLASEELTGTTTSTLALLRPSGGRWIVEDRVGGGLRLGEELPRVASDAIGAAARSKMAAATTIVGTGSDRVLGFAVGPPTAPTGTVLYRQVALGAVKAPREAASAPFHELNVVVYAVASATPAQVVVTTTNALPLQGLVSSELLTVGASDWLVEISPKQPLVGSVAADAWWVTLAVGLVGTLVIAALVDSEARRRAAAVAMYVNEHRFAEAFQRSLLPELPARTGLDLAARYIAGSAGQQVGGDWFDVFGVGADQIGFVIGDVVGHDTAAAAAMSQVRAALRAYAFDGESPAAAIDRLGRFVETSEVTPLVTVFYGVLSPPTPAGDRTLRYANAGHLPPLIVGPAGEVRALSGGTSVVLGAPSRASRAEGVAELAAGSTILLFTDGLVERPGSSLVDDLEQLAEHLGELGGRGTADSLCDQVLASRPNSSAADDTAVLAIRLVSSASPGDPTPRRPRASAGT